MKLRREASLGIGAILTLQILLSMFTIALLTRMGPAIEQILQENVYSSEAVEDMMAPLALNIAPVAVPSDFTEAFERAKNNVTEEPEEPLLAIIDAQHKAAFAGDAQARRETITALQQLGQVNLDSMVRADAKAQRLGQAGAWAAALLGAFALALGIVVYRRLRLRLELPIEQLRRTTQRVRSGNVQARCSVNVGPHEIKQIADDLNWLLDRWLQNRVGEDDPGSPKQREAEIRRALVWLLDQGSSPQAIVDARGEKVCENRCAMLLDEPRHDSAEGGWGAWMMEEISGTSLKFATLATHDPQDEESPKG